MRSEVALHEIRGRNCVIAEEDDEGAICRPSTDIARGRRSGTSLDENPICPEPWRALVGTVDDDDGLETGDRLTCKSGQSAFEYVPPVARGYHHCDVGCSQLGHLPTEDSNAPGARLQSRVVVRILFLTNQYPPHSIGGYALSCQSVVEQFRLRGHDSFVLTSDATVPGVADDAEEATRAVHRDLYLWFRELGREEPTIPRPSLLDRLKYERRNQRKLREILRAWRPDVVSVWEMGAMSLSTLTLVEQAGIPLVLTVHDYWPQYAPEWDPWLRCFQRRPWARSLVRPLRMVTTLPELSDAVVNVISRSLLDEVVRDSRWTFPEAQIIAFGIDERWFPVREPESREWAWRLLYVGRLDWAKGLRTLAVAMRHMPEEASLEVIGTGDPDIVPKIRKIVEENASRAKVCFSSCPRSELAQRYRAADVVVFPSEWNEPFGLVPLEAMACGVPVVATGTGGSGEYLRDGENCLLFPPGDPDGLASTIRRLSTDSRLRLEVSSGGSRTAARYSLRRAVDEIERLHFDAASFRSESSR